MPNIFLNISRSVKELIVSFFKFWVGWLKWQRVRTEMEEHIKINMKNMVCVWGSIVDSSNSRYDPAVCCDHDDEILGFLWGGTAWHVRSEIISPMLLTSFGLLNVYFNFE
jgi:hypothetical protein